MRKPAPTEHEVHELVRERWSPVGFTDRAVGPDELRSLFEAARWAASSYNEQPWRFVVARREDAAAFQRMLDCLAEGNRRWARQARALVLTVASTRFAHNGRPNRHAFHDVGLATAQLSLQAVALGLQVHPMAGFSVERAREVLRVPEGFEPVAMLAIGEPCEPEALPEDLAERQRAPRSRKPQAAFVFEGAWGKPL